MKQLLALLGCAAVLLGLVGCQNTGRDFRSDFSKKLESEGKVPEFLAGNWKADRFDWEIEFKTDGEISRIFHTLCSAPINLSEGGLYQENPLEGVSLTFILGPCKASYNRDKRRLNVKIIMDYFEMKVQTITEVKVQTITLKGRREDYFTGQVSEDGRQWNALVREYSYFEGEGPPDIDYADNHPEPLVFTKSR